jgi:zinc protease
MGQGRDSRLYDALVQQKSLTGDVSAGINWGLGNQFDYAGPMLWMITAYHDSDKSSSALLDVFNAEFQALRTMPIDPITLARAKTKMKSALYGAADEQLGLGKLNLLASFALFDGDPGRINSLDAGFAAVTPQLILKTAQDYLRQDQRTVYTIIPGAKNASGGGR